MDEQASGGGGGGGGGELNDGAEWEQVWERKYSLRKKNKEEKKILHASCSVAVQLSSTGYTWTFIYIIKIYIF